MNLKIILIILGVAILGGASFLVVQSLNFEEGMIEKDDSVEDLSEEEIDKSEEAGREEKENNWEVYRNEEYGFEISHPDEYVIEEEKKDPMEGFSLIVQGESLLSVNVMAIDQIGYQSRMRSLENPENNITELEIETSIIDNAEKSFKAEYIESTHHIANDALEEEEVVQVYALKGKTYLLNCQGNHKECRDITSTFKFLDN